MALIAADRFLGHLDADEGRYNDAKTRLTASLELAERCDAPVEQALTLLGMAQRTAKLGELDEARGFLAQVREICEPRGAKRILECVDSIEAGRSKKSSQETTRHPAGLTPREVEVLQLVAQGMTDAEVAEQLFLSPRTVSSYLSSVYNKLGVNSRTAATSFAVREGLLN